MAILVDMKKPSASDQKPARLLRSKFTSSFVAGGGDVRLTRKHSGNGPRTAVTIFIARKKIRLVAILLPIVMFM